MARFWIYRLTLIPFLFAHAVNVFSLAAAMVRQVLHLGVLKFRDDIRIAARREKIHQVSIRIAE